MHHAFVITATTEEGVRQAKEYIEKNLGLPVEKNPDVIEFRYGLFSVEDARKVASVASQAPIGGEEKAIIIAASRMYHEAQNALLKVFEEPPKGTHLFLVVPTPGMLLPTLRSRVQMLNVGHPMSYISEAAEEFLKASKDKRTAIIKKLTTGKDEDERRENRDAAIEIVNGIEAAAYASGAGKHAALLAELSVLRGYLHDRAAPLKMILEHLSLVLPRGLV